MKELTIKIIENEEYDSFYLALSLLISKFYKRYEFIERESSQVEIPEEIMRKQFNNYMDNEAPERMKELFEELSDNYKDNNNRLMIDHNMEYVTNDNRPVVKKRSKKLNKQHILYHVTTQKKAKLYRQTGHIISPVRGFTTLQGAMAWAMKVGRTVIYEIECDKLYKLPDHHNQFGEAW